MKTAILYTRVSSDDQVKGTSLSVQIEDLKRFCADNGYRIIGHFEDAGESAKTADRPGLIRALIEAKKLKADAFIVHKLDRLSRNATDGLSLKAALLKHGCTLISISEPAGADPAGQFFSTVLFAAAQFDNDIRSARSRSGMVSIAQRGGWNQRAPYGFVCERLPDNLPVLRITHENKDAVAQVLVSYSDGSTTLTSAKHALMRLGFKASKATNIFNQPIYGGIIRNSLTKVDVFAVFPGFVSPDVWYKIESRYSIDRKRTSRAKRSDSGFVLTIFRCPICGKRLKGSFGKSGTGKLYPYYNCSGHVSVRAEKVELAVLEALDELKSEADIMRDAVRLAATQLVATGKRATTETNARASEASKIRTKLTDLADKFVSGDIDSATYKTLQARYNTAIAQIAREDADSDKPADWYQRALLLLEQFRRVSDVYIKMPTNRKRELVTLIFGDLTYIRYENGKVKLDNSHINKGAASVSTDGLKMAPRTALMSNLDLLAAVCRLLSAA